MNPILTLVLIFAAVVVAAVAFLLVEGRRYRRSAERLNADYDHRLDDADIVPVDPYVSRFVD